MAAQGGQTPTELVVEALRAAGSRVSWGSGQWVAQCPAHGDRMPSLTVKAAEDGKALVYCHAGCDTRDILDAIGLRPADLFPDSERDRPVQAPWSAYLDALQQLNAPKAPSGHARTIPDHLVWDKVAHYDYTDAGDQPVARVVRYDVVDRDTGEKVGKTFTQQRWTGTGYINGLEGLVPPLYRLPQVAAAVRDRQPVFVVEGEKDVDTAAGLGVVATTCAMGSGAWRQPHTDTLAGAVVGIIVDQDDAGQRHAAEVREQLVAAGCHVSLFAPKAGKDLTDHVEAGYGMGDLVPLTEVDPEAEARAKMEAYVREHLPRVDWHALWADDSEEEWIVEPLLPARRLVALYSPPKVGKSLLMLEIAAAVASGKGVFGHPAQAPRHVLYVDFENDPKGDVRERLQSMGYGPADLDCLHYLSFPTLAALDSEAGSQQLMAAVTVYGAEVVVIDTVSRAVKGEENENDTWLAFYRHTGLKLKQAGVAAIRLDHTGKDETKGQRGGSAKSGDVDAVWRLSRAADHVYRLDCEANRMPVSEKTLTLHREVVPTLHHRVDALGGLAAWDAQVAETVAVLDAIGVADGAGERVVKAALKGTGHRASAKRQRAAIKVRQCRPGARDDVSDADVVS